MSLYEKLVITNEVIQWLVIALMAKSLADLWETYGWGTDDRETDDE